MTTPEHIKELNPGEYFVFGSNLSGQHAGGAALKAHTDFRAVWGVGEGITGRCYAFPTLDADLKPRTSKELEASAVLFMEKARSMPELTFLLTRVGCGIAGYDEEDMKKLFKSCPQNVAKPAGW